MKKLFTVFLFAEILCGTNIFSQTGWFSQMSGTTNNLNSIYFLNDNIGYAVGDAGTLIMTTNGGNNWNTAIFPYALRSLSFPASSRGYSVGDNGEMLKSTNSGNFWASQISGTSSNLKSFYSPSENIGYVVGEGGVILMTTTGGTVIPVELTSFTALQNRDEVILKWQPQQKLTTKDLK